MRREDRGGVVVESATFPDPHPCPSAFGIPLENTGHVLRDPKVRGVYNVEKRCEQEEHRSHLFSKIFCKMSELRFEFQLCSRDFHAILVVHRKEEP